jgi:hypothetical protein
MIEVIIGALVFLVIWFGTICAGLAFWVRKETGKRGLALCAVVMKRTYQYYFCK